MVFQLTAAGTDSVHAAYEYSYNGWMTTDAEEEPDNPEVKIPLESISLSGETRITQGETKTLSVSFYPANTTDDKTVTFESQNENILKEDENGTVTGYRYGKRRHYCNGSGHCHFGKKDNSVYGTGTAVPHCLSPGSGKRRLYFRRLV